MAGIKLHPTWISFKFILIPLTISLFFTSCANEIIIDPPQLCSASVCLSIENVDTINEQFDVYLESNDSVSFFQIGFTGIQVSDYNFGEMLPENWQSGLNDSTISAHTDSTDFLLPGEGNLLTIDFSNLAEEFCFSKVIFISDLNDTLLVEADECFPNPVYGIYNFSSLEFDSDSTFSVVTWNVENFPKKYNSTIDAMEAVITQMKADVICLQEIIDEAYFNELISLLDDYDGYLSNLAAYDLNLAVLFSSEVELISIFEIYIGVDDWWAFPRPPQVIQLNWQNIELFIINNHFKANDSGTEDEDRRRAASEELENYVNDYLSGENVIIVGDLNDELTEAASENVFWNFISKPAEFQFADMEIAQDISEYQWSYPTWPSHLDHILITDELFTEFENEGSIIKTFRLDDFFTDGWWGYEEYISDHRPVGLRLKF